LKRSQELAGGNTFGVTSLPSIDAGTGDNCALTFTSTVMRLSGLDSLAAGMKMHNRGRNTSA